MRLILTLMLALLLMSLTGTQPAQGAPPTLPTAPSLGVLPLLFIPENDPSTPFSATGLGGRLAFRPTGVVLALSGAEAVQVRFLGANPTTSITPAERQPGLLNRYLGDDPAYWQSGIPTYAALTYEDLYLGIALRYDGQDGRLKGTFTVAPSSDPSSIRWRYEGAQAVALEPSSGDLQIYLPGGRILTESAPVAWQVLEGQRVPVAERFTLDGDQAGFALGAYDPGQPLVIDPTLTYSTYLGGISSDFIHDISLDNAGNIYVAGWTYTNNLGGFTNTVRGYTDAFVVKLNASGSVAWSTYLGRGWDEYASGLDRDANGVIYVAGITNSPDYPTTPGASQRTLGGNEDGFITKVAEGAAPLPSPPGNKKVFLPIVIQ